MADDYTETTRDICVRVRSFYLEDQSQPDEGRYVWAYRVRVENRGSQDELLSPWHVRPMLLAGLSFNALGAPR